MFFLFGICSLFIEVKKVIVFKALEYFLKYYLIYKYLYVWSDLIYVLYVFFIVLYKMLYGRKLV